MVVSFDPMARHKLSTTACTSQTDTTISKISCCLLLYFTRTRGSVVGIATTLRTARFGVRISVGASNVSVLQNFQNQSPIQFVQAFFTGGQSGQGMKLTPQLHLPPRLRTSGATTDLPLCVSMAWKGNPFHILYVYDDFVCQIWRSISRIPPPFQSFYNSWHTNNMPSVCRHIQNLRP